MRMNGSSHTTLRPSGTSAGCRTTTTIAEHSPAKGGVRMVSKQERVTPASDHVAQLEEIARRLTAIHVSLATNLDAGRELQTWTRKEIEGVLAYVDDAIDRQAPG